jgi:lactate racemase
VRLRLDHGTSGLDVTLPDGTPVLERPGAPALDDPAAAIRTALRAPLGTPPLRELARGKRRVCVVISDRTRPIPYGVVLPPLLAELEDAGVARDAIEILIATGLHRPATDAELTAMTSADLVARYRFRNHVARDAASHRHIGTSAQGTAMAIDGGYLDADLKIVTGLVEPHLMAGFSGGPKSIATGIAATETIRRTHGADMLESHCGPGIVAGNPFYADLLEVARHAGVDFLLNVTIDRERRLTGVFAGDLEAAHVPARERALSQALVDCDAAYDVVVTSAAGYPLDATFYQAIKGPVAALGIVKPGGTIILAAEMREGLGSADFQQMLDQLRAGARAMDLLTSPGFFVIDQWMVQHLDQVLRRASLIVVAPGLAPEALRGLPVARAASVEEALEAALARHGAAARVVAIPEGPYVLATIGGRTQPLHGDAAA